jgi:hypothetical protein
LAKARRRNRAPAPALEKGTLAIIPFLVVVGLAVAAAWFVHSHGYTLFYGDAEAHLNIARRIFDSRTPGPEQIGTVWLPLPHLAMLPFVLNDALWRSGLAGTIVGSVSFVFAAMMLFLATRRIFASQAAGWTAMLLFASNPNLLYLQATPMTEPVVFAGLMGLLYSTVCFGETRSWLSVIAAGVFANAAALSRYEGWFVLPFVAAYIALAGGERRWSAFGVFCAMASLAPASWLAHNVWYYGNPLEFYNGPYSAQAIYHRSLDAGLARYPGDHDWSKAVLYFRTAVQLCAGWGLVAIGLLGLIAGLLRKAWWPVLFLMLPPVFYVLSLYSAGTPIFVPTLWPSSYYNTRYGLAALPLLAFGGAALVAALPAKTGKAAAAVALAIAIVPWLAYPRLESVVCWKESSVNSESRRAWTAEAAGVLRRNYRPGSGIFTSFGDQVGVFREAGIPLREVLHNGNGPAWYGAAARPDLFLHEEWGMAIAGDPVESAMLRTLKRGPFYDRVTIITVRDAPALEIYRKHEDPLHKSPRGEERLSAHLGR